MKLLSHVLFLLLLVVSSAAIAATATQSTGGRGEEKDRAAIAKTLGRFLDAWNTHDAHAFSLIFTEDADFTNVAGVHAQGRSNVEAFHAPRFADYFKDSHQTATIRSIRFLKPDLAIVDVDWQMTGARSADGKPAGDRRGLLVWVMAKQADGSWLIEVMHNTDLTQYPVPAR